MVYEAFVRQPRQPPMSSATGQRPAEALLAGPPGPGSGIAADGSGNAPSGSHIDAQQAMTIYGRLVAAMESSIANLGSNNVKIF